MIAYALLQLIVLVRYAADVSWVMPMAWVWVVLLALMLIVNMWAWLKSGANAH